MISRIRRSRKETGKNVVNNPTDKGLDSMPEDILHLIVHYLTYLDRFRLKVVGSHPITTFISGLPRPPFDEYVAQLDMHTSKTVVTKTDSKKALHNACMVGYDALVLKLISKYLDLRSYKLLESCLTTAISSQQKSVVLVVLKYLPLGPFSVFAGLRSSHRHFQGPSYMKKTVAEAALEYAAINNSGWAVQLLLEHGAVATSKRGLHGLCEAASRGHERVVAMLSERIPWQKHNEVLQALNVAAENGHEETVKTLLRTGVKMPQEYYGRSAIHLAASEGHESILRLLLPKVPGDYYVHSGFHNNTHDSVVYTLDTPGYSVESLFNRSHYSYWSCLHFAIYGKHYETVKFLLDSEIAPPQDRGITPSNYLKYRAVALPFAAERGDAGIVNLLLSNGFDVSVKLDGICALELAARNGHTDVMALVINSGISLTVYHLLNAAASGSVPAVSLLLDRGADVRAKSNGGQTPLHIAVNHHHPEVVHLLLRSGAETDATDGYGQTPLHRAIVLNQEECFDLLLEYRTGIDASSGAKIKYEKKDMQYALVFAIRHSRSHMIPRILEYGANINGAVSNGTTPFHEAAARGDIAILEIILASGANKHARDAQQQTALHYAAKNDCGSAVAKLLSWGLDADAKDSSGQVPLHLAHRGSVADRSLIGHGANPNVIDDNGVSVWECQRLRYYNQNCA